MSVIAFVANCCFCVQKTGEWIAWRWLLFNFTRNIQYIQNPMSWNAIKEKQINNKIFLKLLLLLLLFWILAVAVFSKLQWNSDIVRVHTNFINVIRAPECLWCECAVVPFQFQSNSDIHAKEKLREIMFQLFVECLAKDPEPRSKLLFILRSVNDSSELVSQRWMQLSEIEMESISVFLPFSLSNCYYKTWTFN